MFNVTWSTKGIKNIPSWGSWSVLFQRYLVHKENSFHNSYFGKTNTKIQSYITFNMNDSKRSIHLKIYLFANISINWRFCLFSWEIQHFQIFFHVPDTFLWLLNLNAMCTFMYLFVVYFSFADVISAIIHRYVNYFDIQVLMMVTETETLTSTLHHNIFTYLDYVFFLLPSDCRILSIFTFINIQIYIYIYIVKAYLNYSVYYFT